MKRFKLVAVVVILIVAGIANLNYPPPPTARQKPGNPLREYFETNQGRQIHKWMHYFDIYHHHFQRFRGQSPTVLEIGVSHGGSLQMWKHYFGPGARIIGVDIDPRCKAVEEEGIQIIIGDQEDRTFLRNLVQSIGPIDIVIDDGGHRMKQQIASLEELFPAVESKGLYLVEDLHTSYMKNYDGGLRRSGTFIEYSKGLVDRLHQFHYGPPNAGLDPFTHSTDSMTFYDSVLVIEKSEHRQPPVHRSKGVRSF